MTRLLNLLRVVAYQLGAHEYQRAGHLLVPASIQYFESFPSGRIPAEDGRVQRECTGRGASAPSASVIERPLETTEIGGVGRAAEGSPSIDPARDAQTSGPVTGGLGSSDYTF